MQETRGVSYLMMLAALLVMGLLLPFHVHAQEERHFEVVPQLGHGSDVTSVAFSPNGDQVLSGSSDKTLKLWDAATGRLIRTYQGDSGVYSVAFSPDGRRLLSGSGETLMLWDAGTGKLLRSFRGHLSSVRSIAISPDGRRVMSGGVDSIRIWDMETASLLRTSGTNWLDVHSIALSPDGRQLVSGGNGRQIGGYEHENTLMLWDAITGGLRLKLRASTEPIRAVAFALHGREIVAGSYKTISFWDPRTGKLLRRFEGHSNWITTLAISPDGQKILSGSADKKIRLWDAATGQLLRHIDAHSDTILSVAFSPDGRRAVSSAWKGALKIWDLENGAQLHTLEPRARAIRAAAISSDNRHLISGGYDQIINIWDAGSGRLVRSLHGHSGPINSVAFSPNGSRLLSGSSDSTMKLWDFETGREVQTLQAQAGSVNSVAFSRNGRQMLSGGGTFNLEFATTLKLWDVATGNLLRAFPEHSNIVTSVAFACDERQVLSAGSDEKSKIWDAATGALLRTLEGRYVACSPNERYIATGVSNKTNLWDAGTGSLIRSLEGPKFANVTAVAFSPDSDHVLSAGRDQTIRLWDVRTGLLIRNFTGHLSYVNSVEFSSDGRRVISASSDTTIRIWETATGGLLGTLFATGAGEWLALTPEGFFAASAQGGKLLSIVRGLEVFGIEQFYQALYRPDLVNEKLAGDPLGRVKQAAANLDLNKAIVSGSAPKVTIISPEYNRTVTSDLITVEAAIFDHGGGIGKAEWRINGITVGVVNTPAGTLRHTFALDPGSNTIEVVAYNGRNVVASVPATVTVVWAGNEPSAPPRLHLVAVAINDYWDGKLKLTYAVPDANSVSAALVLAGKDLFEEVVVTLVLDSKATLENLDQIFAELTTKIRPRDVFVFYAAGHGVTENGRYYFIPYDFHYETEASYADRGIGQDRLQLWFSKIPAKKSIVIFDTCESGTLTSLRGGFEQLAAVGRLIQATGRTTLAASMDNQPALEGYRGHGVFTYSILDALGRADRNGNGLIEVTELIEHVDELVPEITFKIWGTRQVPRALFQGTNFALGKQISSIATTRDDEFIIPFKPTHVNVEPLEIFRAPGGGAPVIQQLPPFTTVTLVKTDHGWVLIAKNGRALGYVAEAKLQKLN
jgi:WD40 repeat protein